MSEKSGVVSRLPRHRGITGIRPSWLALGPVVSRVAAVADSLELAYLAHQKGGSAPRRTSDRLNGQKPTAASRLPGGAARWPRGGHRKQAGQNRLSAVAWGTAPRRIEQAAAAPVLICVVRCGRGLLRPGLGIAVVGRWFVPWQPGCSRSRRLVCS